MEDSYTFSPSIFLISKREFSGALNTYNLLLNTLIDISVLFLPSDSKLACTGLPADCAIAEKAKTLTNNDMKNKILFIWLIFKLFSGKGKEKKNIKQEKMYFF